MELDEKLLDNLTSQPSLKSRGPYTGYKSSTITDNGLSVFLGVCVHELTMLCAKPNRLVLSMPYP